MKSQSKQSIMEVATEYPKVTTARGRNALKNLWSSEAKNWASTDLHSKSYHYKCVSLYHRKLHSSQSRSEKIKEVRKYCSLLLMGPITK